ncbi:MULTISPECIES: Thivi_2564 family membrane protein [unclassified Legionella]|uniref:Thivi_2564 family membrane protein n=1 Tax=unclassified Legionella TaxID=2622702 RepID=UPI00351CED70
MDSLNQLIMVIITGLIFWAVNQSIFLDPFINLVINFFLLIALVIYLMQFLGLVKEVLPTVKIFK